MQSTQAPQALPHPHRGLSGPGCHHLYHFHGLSAAKLAAAEFLFQSNDQKVETFVGLQNYVTLFTDPNIRPASSGMHSRITLSSLPFTCWCRTRSGCCWRRCWLRAGWGRRFYRTTLVHAHHAFGGHHRLYLAADPQPAVGRGRKHAEIWSAWAFSYKPWLGLDGTALVTVSLISVWQFVGIPMILFYTALIGIPEELVEAAHVDGASGWQIFWRIKFPLICPPWASSPS